MASLSDYLENALLNHILLGTSYVPPTSIYVALYTSDPTDADIGTEVSGNGYARQIVTFTQPLNGQATNAEDIVFPVAELDWGIITHIGLRDAATGGNLLFYSPLPTPVEIRSGDQLVIRANDLRISFD